MQHTDALPLHRRVDNTVVSYARYVGKTIFPTDLSILYPYPDSWARSTVIAAAVLLVAITAFVVAGFKKRPYLAFGWFWFIGTLVPVIGLVQVGMQAMADHYTYLPGIGLFVMLVWGIAEVPKNPAASRTAFAVTATATLAICIAVSVTQLQYWKSSETVFEHAVKVTKNNAMAHFILAHVYQQQNRMEEAGMHVREAMSIALEHFEAAVKEAPDSPDLQANLALALSRQGRFVEADEHFAIAVKLQPNSPTAQFNWGMSCAQSGNFNDAIAHVSEAVRLKPDYKEAQMQLEALKARASRN
jgi:Tfp pilus assembly protein PilF